MAGFQTSAPAFAQGLVPQAKLTPILTSGEVIPGTNRIWDPTPDGLGAYGSNGTITVFAAHELSASGVSSNNGGPSIQYSRVSKLEIDPSSLSVLGGEYLEDGSNGYIRFCSATWADLNEGLPTGYFFAGEESGGTANGSVVVAFDKTGNQTQLPHLGSLAHENTIVVPGFRRGWSSQVVGFTTDDSNAASELYMYVADDEAGFIGGAGKLYVLKTDRKSLAGKPLHAGNLVEGQEIPVYFVEVDDPADLGTAPAARYANLQNKADALGAMPFVRLEDADYDRSGDSRTPRIYFVDTGNGSATGRAAVGADCGGVCDLAGSLYSLTFNSDSPLGGATLKLMKRSKGLDGEWASPDNIAVSRKSIMVMEDPAYDGWDGRRAPGVWNARFIGKNKLGGFTEVAEVTQETLVPAVKPGAEGRCIDTANTCWESSGIISMESLLGAGTWLFVVQGHTMPFAAADGSGHTYGNEAGQLLYLRLPGS